MHGSSTSGTALSGAAVQGHFCRLLLRLGVPKISTGLSKPRYQDMTLHSALGIGDGGQVRVSREEGLCPTVLRPWPVWACSSPSEKHSLNPAQET